MEIGTARYIEYKLTCNGKNVTDPLTPYISDITYTDRITGQADELDVTLADPSMNWMGDWYPQKGDKLEYEWGYNGQKLVKAGAFEIDEIELVGPPNSVRIRAIAVGLSRQARTRIGKSYENTTLKAIIEKAAKRIGAVPYGTIANISIAKVTQYGETDWGFLVRLCGEYGYSVKLTDNNKKLVVEKIKNLAGQQPIRKLAPHLCTNWTFRDKITEVPAKVENKRHSGRKKKTTKGQAKSGLVTQGTTSSDTRKTHISAGSKAQSQAIAEAEQERHEIDKTSATITLPADPLLVSGASVELEEWKKLDGTYVVTEASHSTSSANTTIQLKRVKEKTA